MGGRKNGRWKDSREEERKINDKYLLVFINILYLIIPLVYDDLFITFLYTRHGRKQAQITTEQMTQHDLTLHLT